MDTAIQVENLGKIYRDGKVEVVAVDSVDLSVRRGEVIGIMSPSGSSKTTLLSMVGCIIKPTSGKIRVDGEEATNMTERITEEKAVSSPPKIIARGVVVSEANADVSSEVLGLIQEILVDEDEHVTKGQTLVILDDQEIKAQLKEAKALMKKAKAEYEKAIVDHDRYERLYRSGAVPLAVFEEFKKRLKLSESELLRAKARLARLKTILQDHRLRTPINGTAIAIYHKAGEVVTPGSPVITVTNMDVLKVKAELDETDVGKVHVGQRVEVKTDAYPDRIYSGMVEKTSMDVKRKRIRSFDPMAWMYINTQEIIIKLDSHEGLLMGMTVDVIFLSEEGMK